MNDVTIVIRRDERDLVTINTNLEAPVAAEMVVREIERLETNKPEVIYD